MSSLLGHDIVAEKSQPTKDIILFGSTGSGKSSVINMLIGPHTAKVDNGANGCTFNSSAYPLSLGGIEFTIHDTAGLNEGWNGTVPNSHAMAQLYELLRRCKDGISLLIYCVRAGRMGPYTEALKQNWAFFYEILCKKQVPIILLVTNVESDEGSWLDREDTAQLFRDCAIFPNGAACITPIVGPQRYYQDLFNKSKVVTEKLILQHYGWPWSLRSAVWAASIYHETLEADCWTTLTGRNWGKSKVKDEFHLAMEELRIDRKEIAAFEEEIQKVENAISNGESPVSPMVKTGKGRGWAFPRLLPISSKTIMRQPQLLFAAAMSLRAASSFNIVLFGDSSKGLIQQQLETSLSTKLDAKFKIVDTTQLDLDDDGYLSMSSVRKFYQDLKKAESISLLVHCVWVVDKSPDLDTNQVPTLEKAEVCQYQWNICYKIMCKQKVPIVLIPVAINQYGKFGGEQWWATPTISSLLRQKRMHPHGVGYFDPKDKDTWTSIAALIRRRYGNPWRFEKTRWIFERVDEKDDWRKVLPLGGLLSLERECGFPKEHALQLATELNWDDKP
ncbi:hypothetical protein CPB83DRAFT_911057 [Crepidotus variabilis]|uniref:G domain-containing protein n=1 Tax=Crepidotus variabilis TaxID=179855 RepID=A0A9P6E5E1_9AGAR|nr:hypothetical protein CPB83DRAFT_911057 [Crepidotus variabilis]